MKKIILLLIILAFQTAISQENNNNTEIAFLGTFHFAGSSDMMGMRVEDMEGEERQRQIVELVDKLAKYKPNKVILEYPYGNSKLDSLYQAYLKGEHELTINERQQLGFRLAKKLGHDHIYVADHRMELPFNEMTAYLDSKGQTQVMIDLMADMQKNAIDVMQKAYDTQSLSEFFVFMNQDQFDNLNMNVYLERLTPIGAGDGDSGLKVTTTWWARNFKIMQNIDRILEEGDRALAIFGQGHTAILKNLYKGRSDVDLVDILHFLKQ